MSTLPELQREFARAIRQPDANIAGLRAVANGRMGIYTDGYKTRLRDALRINFPALHRVQGDDAFTDLAHRYLDAMPSAYRSIRWFGRELEDFSRRDAANLSHPALLDLLRMDWAIGTAFDASDALPLTQGQLRAVPPEQWATIALVLHPSVTRLKLDWAVEPIWRAVMRELNDDSAADADDAAPEANAHHLLIWRDALEARWRILDNDEAQALEQIGGASTFGALCEYLVTQGNAVDAAQTAARYLARWVADGVLTAPPTHAATRREPATC